MAKSKNFMLIAALLAVTWLGISDGRGELPEAKKPAVQTMIIGKSVQGRQIRMHIFGNSGPTVFIFGGIHGDEPESHYVALCLIDYLLAHEQLYAERRIAVIPAANPDGIVLDTRKNAKSVDCNRNFPTKNWRKSKLTNKLYGGPAPASEPETKAIMGVVDTLKPARIVSMHTAVKDKVPFCIDPDGPAMKLGEAMAEKSGYPLIRDMGYRTPGSFGTWAGEERGIPTITLELRDLQSWPKLWQTHRDALVAAIEYSEP